ncbi:EAL domain-containing protein [Gorillibacterium sp. sgz500922]|uniref:EAL domain-containing protein n=1 Tax=Gorillibacterium sp. sgz500922 TaxID=3446694 RepID=UPI003F67869E
MGKELVINGALLIAFLFFFYQLTDRIGDALSRAKAQVLHGLGCGLLGILLMLFTVKAAEHVIVDFRAVPVMLAAAFGGPFASVLAALVIGAVRVLLYGVNFASEIAVANLCLIAMGAILIKRLRRPPFQEWIWMNASTVAFSAVCLMLVIPGTLPALKTTALYCLILIPVSSLSYLFASEQLRSHDNARELKRKTTELTQIFDHVGSAIWSWNQKTGEISVSREIEKLCGYDHAAFLKDPLFWRTILHPDDNLTYEAVWERIAAGENVTRECRLIQPDGREIWVQESFRPLLDKDGSLEKVIGSVVDVTALKEQEQQLRESRNRLSITLDSIGDGVITTDAVGDVQYLNPVAAQLTGWSSEEALGRKIETVMPIYHEQTREPVLSPIYRAISERRPVDMPAETCLVRRDGSELPIDDSASPIYDEQGRVSGVVLVFRDIQERRLQEERIRHYAFHDALTGLPNRRFFRDKLAACIESQPAHSSLALLFIDLDHFKLINDSLGHEMGDQLLIEVARRLKECAREQDTVSRLAGDEFTVILRNVTLKEAGEHALYIKQSLSRKYRLGERECFTSPSIGISLYPQDGQDVDTLIKCADTAMYHVKTHEKNHFRFFSADMTEKVLRKVEIDKGLRSALETDSLRLEYQPKVDLETGKLTGFEALLRWDHPEWGPISPDEFIPVAEESGLIIPLGEWVLRTGCRQFRKWLSTGNPGERLAVNLSVKQLQDPGLPALVERVLEEEQLSADQLELEITETIMKQGEHTVHILEHLKAMGIYISIDDFGTGYSSLSYLNRLPIDALKIDKSFIRNIYTDHADSEIVTTIITLAKSLNLKVIAEGVETAEQLDFLRSNNCHEGQGYLIGRPSRPEAIEEALLCR